MRLTLHPKTNDALYVDLTCPQEWLCAALRAGPTSAHRVSKISKKLDGISGGGSRNLGELDSVVTGRQPSKYPTPVRPRRWGLCISPGLADFAPIHLLSSNIADTTSLYRIPFDGNFQLEVTETVERGDGNIKVPSKL